MDIRIVKWIRESQDRLRQRDRKRPRTQVLKDEGGHLFGIFKSTKGHAFDKVRSWGLFEVGEK